MIKVEKGRINFIEKHLFDPKIENFKGIVRKIQ